jgi:hypothetical protein
MKICFVFIPQASPGRVGKVCPLEVMFHEKFHITVQIAKAVS